MTATGKASKKLAGPEKAFADAALSYPEVVEENPWGHRAFKVKKKAFLFMGVEPNHLGLSTKLPHSNAVALTLPFAEPTGYGLGKSGWVSASFTEADEVPVALLLEWIDESYRAIAPKKLVASLGERAPVKAPPPARRKALPAKEKALPAKKKALPAKKKAAPAKKKAAPAKKKSRR